MEKPIVNMINWQLCVRDEKYSLSGTAENHPSLGKGAYISHTSKMVRYSLEVDILIYETRNTLYKCPLKYMTVCPYGNISEKDKEKLTQRDRYSDDDLDRIVAAAARMATNAETTDSFLEHIVELQKQGQEEIKRMEEEDDQRLRAIAMQYEDCVYIEVSNIEHGDKLTYHFGPHVGFVQPVCHSGMFQDSVLYVKGGSKEKGEICFDLSYYPVMLGRAIETYAWSDNIKNVVIKNECSYDIAFNKNLVEQGETKVFQYEENTNE